MCRKIAYWKLAGTFGVGPYWIMFTPYGAWYLLDTITGTKLVDATIGCILMFPVPIINILYLLKYLVLIWYGNYKLAAKLYPWKRDWQLLLLIAVPYIFYIYTLRRKKVNAYHDAG